MNTILKYPGAKNRLVNWLICFVPEHKLYIEPFFGSGALLFNKKPAYLETINDIDGDIINFFKVMREDGESLSRAIALTPYAREEYEAAYKPIENIDSFERARRFAVKCWQGFGCGNRYKNGFRSGKSVGSPNPARAWSSLPETIQFAVYRLKKVQIENKNAIKLISEVRDRDAFIYADPPYLLSTRKKYLYNNEMTDKEHEELLKVLIDSPAKIMLSGYDNEMYNDMLCGWNRAETNSQAENGLSRTEVIWYNYDLPNQINLQNYLMRLIK